jgi:hypothetical protein
MHRPLLLAAVLALAPAVPLAAQAPAAVGTALTREDSAGIRAAAEDYLIGWYDGDAARMERALHPDLAKRSVQTQNGRSRLSNMGAMAMVQMTRGRAASPQPADQRLLEITLLDGYGTMALAKVVSWDFVDYISLAKSDGRWVIVNDLWDRRAR